MKPAEEIAAEMVSEPCHFASGWQVPILDAEEGTFLAECENEEAARRMRDVARRLFARLIDRERAAAYEAGKRDGAQEERERTEAEAEAHRAKTVALFDAVCGPGWRDQPEPKVADLDPEILAALFSEDD